MNQYGTLSYEQRKVTIDRNGNVSCRYVQTTIRNGVTRAEAVDLVATIRKEMSVLLPADIGGVFFHWQANPETL